MLVKITEVSGENSVKTLFDEVHGLGAEHSIKALYVKHRSSVTKTLSSRTKVIKVLGAMITFRGELKYCPPSDAPTDAPTDAPSAPPSYNEVMAMVDTSQGDAWMGYVNMD